jgi:Arc/MetJ family transcription regulator
VEGPTPTSRENCLRLTYMHEICILMHMRSTLNIDDDVLRRAAELTGEKEKTALVRMGLEALIARESARRLARLGGTERNLSPIRRRRTRPAK